MLKGSTRARKVITAVGEILIALLAVQGILHFFARALTLEDFALVAAVMSVVRGLVAFRSVKPEA